MISPGSPVLKSRQNWNKTLCSSHPVCVSEPHLLSGDRPRRAGVLYVCCVCTYDLDVKAYLWSHAAEHVSLYSPPCLLALLPRPPHCVAKVKPPPLPVVHRALAGQTSRGQGQAGGCEDRRVSPGALVTWTRRECGLPRLPSRRGSFCLHRACPISVVSPS